MLTVSIFFFGTCQATAAETTGYHSTGEVGFFGSYEKNPSEPIDGGDSSAEKESNDSVPQFSQGIQSVIKQFPKTSEAKASFTIVGLLIVLLVLLLFLIRKRREEE